MKHFPLRKVATPRGQHCLAQLIQSNPNKQYSTHRRKFIHKNSVGNVCHAARHACLNPHSHYCVNCLCAPISVLFETYFSLKSNITILTFLNKTLRGKWMCTIKYRFLLLIKKSVEVLFQEGGKRAIEFVGKTHCGASCMKVCVCK